MLSTDELLARCTFPDGHLHCAVSGGADSLALLALAVSTGQPATAFHVDHQLRPGGDDEAAHVERIARKLGASFVALRVTIEHGPNLEARARLARFAALPEDVLTGHTADDQAETMLANLMRGAGLNGMAGMKAERHPILNLRRSETHDLCQALDLQPFADPTNEDPRFVRNRIRNELLPLMEDIASRDVAPILARQAPVFGEAAALLDTMAASIDVTDAKALAQADSVLAARAVRQWLAAELDDESHPPDAISVERVLGVARGDAVACNLAGGFTVRRSNQRLSLSPPT